VTASTILIVVVLLIWPVLLDPAAASRLRSKW
jgi:hypothetical protein